MKKSTRFLALLLCLVMVATLLPAVALADVGTTVVDPKNSLSQDILTLTADRYSINVGSEIKYTDTGYGYETTYLFPRGEGTKSFVITRTAYDINRWWRWGIEGTNYSQQKSNGETGYSESWTTGVDGMDANIVWVTRENTGWFVWEDVPHYMEISKDSERDRKYIASKVIRRYCYRWAGGSADNSANVEVSIDRTLPLGTSSVLWSANGTDAKQLFQYGATVVHATKNDWAGGLHYDEGHYVYYGDMGQNFMRMAEPRYVTYQLDGGNMNGDPNDQQYVVWTTGTAKTSQKHRVISDVPSKQGMVFDGWYCNELGKMVNAGTDLNNGITSNMTLVAKWKNDIEDPDYFVSFDGNGNTNTDVTMPNQEFEFDAADTLSTNRYIQEYTVTYMLNDGTDTVLYDNAVSSFKGWSTAADTAAVYADRALVMNLADRPESPDEKPVVPLYAQWQYGSVIPETPEREITDDDSDDNIIGWHFDGWFDAAAGGNLVTMGGVNYVPGGNKTLYAHWTAVKGTKFNVVHVTNGVAGTPVQYDTEDYDTFNTVALVTNGYLYGGTFIDAACTSIASNDPTKIYPVPGETYYIWEVSSKHLNPMTVSVWANVDGGYDITHIYLMTAVDRIQYNQAGFTVNGKDYVAANSTDKDIYDQVGITQSGKTTYKSYYDLSRADTTQNSKVACMEVTVPTTATNVTVVPYWITMDGVKVTGPAQRIFQYMGPGATNSNRTLKIVSDTWINPTATLAPAPVSFNAPLMAAPRFMASQASPVVVQTPDIITVFDAGKEYTIEAVNNSIKGLIQPAGVDGQLFSGWFADEALTAAADLGNVSDGDSVYAKYISGNYLQVKYASVFTLLSKTISLTAAVDSKDYAETGFVIETKKGTDTVVVNSYATKFALQNAGQLFGVEKNAPLMNVDYKLNGLSRNDKVTITPYWVTADGTTVYGTARTLTFNGLVMKG